MFRFSGRTHRFDLKELANGRAIFVYPQNKVVADLFDARAAAGGRVVTEGGGATGAAFWESSGATKPTIRYRAGRESQEIECDFIAGCDGFHGVCRPSVP